MTVQGAHRRRRTGRNRCGGNLPYRGIKRAHGACRRSQRYAASRACGSAADRAGHAGGCAPSRGGDGGHRAERLCEALRGAFTLRVVRYPLEAFKTFCGLVGRHSADTKSLGSPDGPQGHKKTAHAGRSGVMNGGRVPAGSARAQSGCTALQARYHLPLTV